MVIKPKVRGFVCITAHPAGCAAHVQEWIAHVKSQPPLTRGPKKVLVLGASTGYGLASRVTAAFGAGAATLGVFFERPSEEDRPASPGWYNTIAFTEAARAAGLYAKTSTVTLFPPISNARPSTSSAPILARSISSSTPSPHPAAPIRPPAPSTSPSSSRLANLIPIRRSIPTRESSAPLRSSPPMTKRSPTRPR